MRGVRVRGKVASVSAFLEEQLKLKVNRQKSAVAPVRERKFLGYRLLGGGSLTVSPKSLKRMKDRVRFLTKRNRPIPFDKRIKAGCGASCAASS